MPRLFVAVEPPLAVQEAVVALARGLPGARAPSAERVHLTLRFLGELDEATARAVSEAVGSVRGVPFALRGQGVGRFPPRGTPRVAWLGLAPSAPLAALHGRIESALEDAGIAREPRPFHPHLTVARLRGTPGRALRSWLARHADVRTEPFLVEELVLMSSVLQPQGPVHRVERGVRLDESPPAGEQPVRSGRPSGVPDAPDE